MVAIRHNQSLLDVAVQESGSVFAAFDWAVKNEISVSVEITPGQLIEAPESKEHVFEQVANYFKNNGVFVGTKYTPPIIPIINYEFPQGEFPISL